MNLNEEKVMNTAEFAQLLGGIPNMNHQQRKQLLKELEQQGDNSKVIEMIETGFDAKAACPHCAHTDLYRHGVVSGLQRYRCRNCKKTFNALTKTPLARLREKQKWLSYLAAMADSQTVRKSAVNAGVHRNTSFRLNTALGHFQYLTMT
jgi:transposase-like protein